MELSLHRLKILIAILATGLLFATLVIGEEECLNVVRNERRNRSDSRAQKVRCFMCDSREDARCHDPFNFTLFSRDMPNVEDCNGCCVKIVSYATGPYIEHVKRTCTEHMHINLFMVDHVCMKESAGRGHMCFCEEDMCNGAARTDTTLVGALAMFLVTIALQRIIT